MQNVASERLKHVLNYWYDMCWYSEATVRTIAGEVPSSPKVPKFLAYWRNYERTVFDNTVVELPHDDWIITAQEVEMFWPFEAYSHFPFEFFQWSRKSRKSFHLPSQLHHLFAVATYPRIRWGDVLLPFDSFVISLEDPIHAEEQKGMWVLYDAILVTRHSAFYGDIDIRLLRRPLVDEAEQRFAANVKDRFEVLLKRGDREKTLRFLEKKEATAFAIPPGWRATSIYFGRHMTDATPIAIEPNDILSLLPSKEVAKMEGGVEENLWRFEPLSWAAKIVIGWCLYLQSLPSASLSWKKRERQQYISGRRGVTGVITQVDHICTILGVGKLDPLRYGLTEDANRVSTGFFKRPHWRRAHMRREPGTPPSAERTQKIPPLLIRRDLIPYFGVIGGTKVEVLPEE
ncbi:hypothetical protein A3C18_02740 [Candidatus Kaiserbacteria bacterium RIFCSPHIGHO2_02_FULL_54_11b]|uniref:Uncharacterized protein n=2 Tax=Candidatus Kaiseribacteriota TaxID=1752734 RepID=A0A1F6CRS6_9BACT|nr:MAG: hypothetical protein A2704_00825 [Candidatus Kaiserbacteria bacterium RIFCSPHIGHO2_01_FULL_54_36b]OGG64925.1 MAG: hypothetical protein A3C18_02740 [Candidatus Kaiserbacteria bacterium RIFCSPHIGHO2_02_FULL_54_11b]